MHHTNHTDNIDNLNRVDRSVDQPVVRPVDQSIAQSVDQPIAQPIEQPSCTTHSIAHLSNASIQLKESVKSTLHKYFLTLEGASTSNLHQLIISVIEKPLLETVMQHAANNQSKAAKWLGLSRNTLRKLLIKHAIHK